MLENMLDNMFVWSYQYINMLENMLETRKIVETGTVTFFLIC